MKKETNSKDNGFELDDFGDLPIRTRRIKIMLKRMPGASMIFLRLRKLKKKLS